MTTQNPAFDSSVLLPVQKRKYHGATESKVIPVELLVRFKSFIEEPENGKFFFVVSLIQRRFHPKDLKVPHFHYRIAGKSIEREEPDREGDIVRYLETKEIDGELVPNRDGEVDYVGSYCIHRLQLPLEGRPLFETWPFELTEIMLDIELNSAVHRDENGKVLCTFRPSICVWKDGYNLSVPIGKGGITDMSRNYDILLDTPSLTTEGVTPRLYMAGAKRDGVLYYPSVKYSFLAVRDWKELGIAVYAPLIFCISASVINWTNIYEDDYISYFEHQIAIALIVAFIVPNMRINSTRNCLTFGDFYIVTLLFSLTATLSNYYSVSITGQGALCCSIIWPLLSLVRGTY
jgi:hypothetical protein